LRILCSSNRPGLWLELSPRPGETLRIGAARADEADEANLAGVKNLFRWAEQSREAGVRLDGPPNLYRRLMEPVVGRPEKLLARALLAELGERALADRPAAMGVSLSHSGWAVLAATRTLRSRGGAATVGVDLEPLSREPSARLRARIHNPSDRVAEVPAILVWAAKEAVFKAAVKVQEPSFALCALTLAPEGADTWQGRAEVGGEEYEVSAREWLGYAAVWATPLARGSR
jgi:hypothetical protein